MEYEDYLRFLDHNNIPRLKSINPNVCDQLVSIIVQHNPQKILEIGRFKGHSMGMFRFLLPNSQVYSIDVVHHPEVEKINDVFGNCVLIDGTSDELQHISDKFDLILIDGDHSYSACLKDWVNVQNRMEEKCLVLFDDLQHPRGCGKVFYEIDSANYTKEIIVADSVECMGVVRKSLHVTDEI